MVLEDITNKSKFRLHVDLGVEYATTRSTRQRGCFPVETLRLQGSKAIDLWTDGGIYPSDPQIGAPPSFRNITQAVCFLGDGYHGLLGYCQRLFSLYLEEHSKQNETRKLLESCIADKLCGASKIIAEKEQMVSKFMAEKEQMMGRIKDLEERVKKQKNMIVQSKESTHVVIDNYLRLRNSTRNLRRRVDHFTNLPMGFSARQRKRKSLRLLSEEGGARKRRLRKTRECAQAILGCTNFEESMLDNVISKLEITNMIANPANSALRARLLKHILRDFEEIIRPIDMLAVCDLAGISDKGYRSLYTCITARLRNKGMKRSMLPTPYSMAMARKSANNNIADMLGSYRWVDDSMQISPSNQFVYNKFNNIYLQVEELQRAMILYYDLTLQETDGKAIFVLKLDECQVVKGQKVERTSLTLMSRALKRKNLEDNNNNVTVGNVQKKQRKQDYYGVQSEKNIWWQAAWALPKENHDSLRWYFNQTGIIGVIQQQSNGQTLHVPGKGEFEVEWHLGGDLKTLKCMLGTKSGANTLFPCIYCTHPKIPSAAMGKGNLAAKSRNPKQVNAKNTGQPRKGDRHHIWLDGILSSNQDKAPSRAEEDPSWNPILPIPLSRVHMCTLHARLRILDKLLRLHVNYAWNMEPESRRTQCIKELEEILSSIGLHSGAVNLSRDTKNPSSTQDNPNKICMGGAKARHLLDNFSDAQSHTQFQIWKQICDTTTFRGNEMMLGLKRARVWETCSEMIRLLEQPYLSDAQIVLFKKSIDSFTQQMVDAWGETHITHYMHILYAHSSFFLNEYGSLAIWSNQGMEKSHYQAKAAFFKSTGHGGGRVQSNAFVQMFNWFYRALIGRKEQKKAGNISLRRHILKVVSARRREGYNASLARERARQWRSERQRKGRAWLSMR